MNEREMDLEDRGLFLMEEVVAVFGKDVKISLLIRAPDTPIVLLSNEKDISVIKDYVEYITSPPPKVLH